MKLPQIKDAPNYKGLYIVDFGDHSAVGYTADEVQLLLESEKFQHIKVYKIHNAYPDGSMELKGITNDTFQLEQGMFFYAHDKSTAEKDFKKLISIAVSSSPPCRAKAHLAKYSDDKFVTALIFPAEYNDEISRWLLDADYKTAGSVDAGTSAVSNYYSDAPQILERHQLSSADQNETRSIDQLLKDINNPIQRMVS